MTRALLLGVSILLASCNEPTNNVVQVGSLELELPSSWTRTDTRGGKIVMAVFAPPENQRKETISIIRSQVGEIATVYTTETLTRLAQEAQGSLPGAKVSRLTPIRTDCGLAGVRVDVDFTPRGLAARYHRVHAILIAGQAIVHVVYTSPDPDDTLAVFRQALDTIHEET